MGDLLAAAAVVIMSSRGMPRRPSAIISGAGRLQLAALFLLIAVITLVSSTFCDTTVEYAKTYEFQSTASAPKLSVIGFRADIRYVYGDPGKLYSVMAF
jgi:hypothetical protein